MFVIPSSLEELSGQHWFDHPWPSDLRRDPDGFIHFGGFINPQNSSVVTEYVASTVGLLDGFSPAATGYLRFTGDIDPNTLPATPPDTLAKDATLSLIDIDPSSPSLGQRHLVQTYWQKAAGEYWVSDTLAVAPALGYPLLPNTKYAYVVTKGVHDTKGLSVQPSLALKEILGLSPPTSVTSSARTLFAPAVAELAKEGVSLDDVAHLAIFTTTDPTAELIAVHDTLMKQFPAPTIDPTTWVVNPKECEGFNPPCFSAQGTGTDFNAYEGWYGPVPNYQAGKLPFVNYGDGGGFQFDKSGNAIVQTTPLPGTQPLSGCPLQSAAVPPPSTLPGSFQMRFTLVVPNTTTCPMPTAGYPIVLYAHGTGGDYRSIVEEGNSIGDVLSQHCLASMGVDEIDHGARPGAPPEYCGPNETDPNPSYESNVEILFFNLQNPIAARTNGREGAIDITQQARLFTETHASIPASVSLTGQEILFDSSKLLFFGHSQGGLSGPLFLAVDNQARGGVLSGSASMMTIALLDKVAPVNIPDILDLLLEIGPSERSELNLFHPALSMAQALVDVLDPIHYVGNMIQHPRAGFAPKTIYQTEGTYSDGLGDDYAPPHGIEIQAVATGLPLMAPPIHPIVEASWSGLGTVTIPSGGLTGNLAGDKATGLLAQFKPSCATETVPCPDENGDGHFVVFDVPQCHEQAAQFCENLAANPIGNVPPLGPP
jgi:hypothetical protein